MAHQGLSSQMEYDLRIHAAQSFLQRSPIPDVGNPAVHAIGETAGLEDTRSFTGWKGQANDIGSQVQQPGRKPAALEPCVACDENPAAGESSAMRGSLNVMKKVGKGQTKNDK